MNDFKVKSGKVYRPIHHKDGSLYVYRNRDGEEYVTAVQLRGDRLFGASRKFKLEDARKGRLGLPRQHREL